MSNYNSNTLILIPKCKEADNVNQFKPIALANLKFKIITKVIVARLASILPTLISLEQCGFRNGNKIRDSFCLAFEAMNPLNQKCSWGNVALKIDISKAFDYLS